jgi:hypothetical protein
MKHIRHLPAGSQIMRLSRRQTGSALFLFIAGAFLITGLAFSCFCLIRIISGFGELESGTEAGTLNVAKQSLSSVGVPLLPGEVSEFGDLVDTNGLITLRTYNQVVARAILTVLHAQQVNTPRALSKAMEVASMAQCGEHSIGSRLHDVVENAANTDSHFASLSGMQGRWVIGSPEQVDRDCEYAFTQLGGTSNIFIDYRFVNADEVSRLQSMDALCTRPDGNTYFRGYHTIDLGSGCVFQLIPLIPGTEPHLIADDTFNRGSETNYTESLPRALIGKVPPNSVKVVSAAPIKDLRITQNAPAKQQWLKAHSNAVLGPLSFIAPASFASSYSDEGHAREFYFPPAQPTN